MAKRSGSRSLRPGSKAPESGQFRGSKTHTEVTSVRGEPLPPGPKGTTYRLVDRTKHAKR